MHQDVGMFRVLHSVVQCVGSNGLVVCKLCCTSVVVIALFPPQLLLFGCFRCRALFDVVSGWERRS